MKPAIHSNYTRSSIRKEMASARKSGKSQLDETPSRAAQEEDRRPWMSEVPNEGDYGEENDAPRGRFASARR